MAKQPASPFEFDVSKYFVEMKIPGVDVEALVSAQKKNMDALTNANKVALEGIQSLISRQAEIFRQTMEEATTMANSLTASGTPQEKVSKQAELTKAAFEHALSNAKEVSEIISKSNTEVAALLNARMTQAMEELKSALEQAGKGK